MHLRQYEATIHIRRHAHCRAAPIYIRTRQRFTLIVQYNALNINRIHRKSGTYHQQIQ